MNIQNKSFLIVACTLSFITGMINRSCHNMIKKPPNHHNESQEIISDFIHKEIQYTSSLAIEINKPIIRTPPQHLSQHAQENWLLLQQPAIKAYLEMISFAEGTQKYGYHTMFGGNKLPHLRYHPGGAAAGKYQFLPSTWQEVSQRIGLINFSPLAQDLAAIEKLKERDIITPLLRGQLNTAIKRGAQEWASLPYEGRSLYGMNGQIGAAPPQPSKPLYELGKVYQKHLQ